VRLQGINVSVYEFNVYAIPWLLAIVAGIITTAMIALGSPMIGNIMNLLIIPGYLQRVTEEGIITIGMLLKRFKGNSD
jgi:ABC-type xylose transport system permease subunit